MFEQEMRKCQGTPEQIKSFYRVVGGVFFCLGLLFLWRQKAAYPIFLGLGASIIILGIFLPKVLKPLYRAWMFLSFCMGFVMSRVVLSIVYYLLVSPLALIARLVGKKFLETRFRTTDSSYWIVKKQPESFQKHYEQQF